MKTTLKSLGKKLVAKKQGKRENKVPGQRKFNLPAIPAGFSFRRSIGFKLFIVFLLSIILTSAAVGFISLQISTQAIKDKVGGNAQQTTEKAAKDIDLWMEQMDRMYNQTAVYITQNKWLTSDRNKMSIALADADADLLKKYTADLAKAKENQTKVQESLKNATDDKIRVSLRDEQAMLNREETRLNNLIKPLTKDVDGFDAVIVSYLTGLVNANAEMISSIYLLRDSGASFGFTSSSKKEIKPDLFKQTWALDTIKAKTKNTYLQPQEGSYVNMGSDKIFAISKAFQNTEDMKWSDILVIEFKLSFLEKMFQSTTFGGIGNVSLVGGDNKTIFSNLDGVKFQDPALVNWDPNQQQQTLKGTNGTSYMVTSMKAEKQPWTLLGTIEVSKLLSDAKTIQNTTFLLLGGAVILAILLGIWGYKTIGKPLMRIRKTMKSAEEGDLNVRLSFKRQDEIGGLAISFNNMLERIRQIVVETRKSADWLYHSTERINQLADESQGASKEIAISMEEVSQGAVNLATDAERSNLLTVSLYDQLNDVLDKNKRMQSVSHHVEQASQDGVSVMEGLAAKNKNVEAIVTELSEKIRSLHASTESISSILELLNGISRRINILSLNASIVAASAGEAGKGFMVVAHEIRNLANQSNDSISSVSDVIHGIQEEMQQTNELVRSSLPIFREQMDSAQSSQAIFQQVEGSMQEFKDSFENVWKSLNTSIEAQKELSSVMMQVSAVSEESSATTEHVSGLVTRQYESSERVVEMGKELERLSVDLTELLKIFKTDETAEAAAMTDQPEKPEKPTPDHSAA